MCVHTVFFFLLRVGSGNKGKMGNRFVGGKKILSCLKSACIQRKIIGGEK